MIDQFPPTRPRPVQVPASNSNVRKAAEERAGGTVDPFPRVQGRCPTCGTQTLFLGLGGYVTCSWIECSRPDHASDVLDFPADLPAAPAPGEGVETVEYRTLYAEGVSQGAHDAAQALAQAEAPGDVAQVRTRVSYPDRVSEWTPVEPETSEPEGSVCICGGDGVRYTLGAERDCPVHGFPRTSEPEGGDRDA